MSTAWIGLGANLGRRDATLSLAFEALRSMPEVLEARMSPCYETDAVGPPQPAYLNACARLRLQGFSPRELLEKLLDLEKRLGRVRTKRWEPRVLDLDLLLFDALVLEEPGLSLPHPRMHERAFVLRPLADLDPGLIHPAEGRSVSELIAAVGMGGVRPWLS